MPLATEVRRGTYLDSVVLMLLQRGLEARDGVRAAGALMGTPANHELLRDSGLWEEGLASSRPDDLVLAVRAETAAAAEAALAAVDGILQAESPAAGSGAYRARSLATALRDRASARWVLVSVPGRWAAPVAEEALAAGRNVFLYSDNVGLEDEVRLKDEAARRGLLLLGPDCGTARLGGVGLGFANRVREGGVGLVGASGTGLQALMVEIHRQGAGVSQAIGVGGRDLSPEVDGRSTRAALRLLARDPGTRVIVLVSKPPTPRVCARLLGAARGVGKPVVACFLGFAAAVERLGNVRLAPGIAEAARLAVQLASPEAPTGSPAATASRGRWIRGLFAGGTLAQELQLALRPVLDPLWSNAPVDGVGRLEDPRRSREHTVVDLGADELTVGRPHPMIDPASRAERLKAELADPDTAAVVVDVVLGDGSHPDPAGPIVAALAGADDPPPVLAWVVGTELDPQDLGAQVERLRGAGVSVHRHLADLVEELVGRTGAPGPPEGPEIDLADVAAPLDTINVGLEGFAAAIEEQEGRVVRVDWRPPAGGDEKLAGILARMKRGAQGRQR